jgi:hypothetical protein
MKGGRAVIGIIGGQEVVAEVVQALGRVLIGDVSTGREALLSLICQEENLAVLTCSRNLVLDLLAIFEPKELRGFVEGHVGRRRKKLGTVEIYDVAILEGRKWYFGRDKDQAEVGSL